VTYTISLKKTRNFLKPKLAIVHSFAEIRSQLGEVFPSWLEKTLQQNYAVTAD